MLSNEILANRRRFINALRTNAPGYKQAFGSLNRKSPQGEVCALGMALDEFGLGKTNEDPYAVLANLFGLRTHGDTKDAENIQHVVYLNDTKRLSFSTIANELAYAWGIL